MTLTYKISDTGEHTFISVNGRLLAVVSSKKLDDDVVTADASGEWAPFFEKYGILPTMMFANRLGGYFGEKKKTSAIEFFREFCWGRRERGRECAVALKRCPLFNVCNGNKGFWDDVDEIEVDGVKKKGD